MNRTSDSISKETVNKTDGIIPLLHLPPRVDRAVTRELQKRSFDQRFLRRISQFLAIGAET